MPEQLTIKGELEDVVEYFMEQGWTDGLPILPPTQEAVTRMLRYTDRDPDESMGTIAPYRNDATVHAVAVNAVMAGCKPEYFPVVLAAVAGICEPTFNVSSLQATTNPTATLVIVNGPLAQSLNFNGKGNCLGPGWRANATVGRAVRLCMLNIGGGLPQKLDKATHGQPGKYTMCIAENEEESPWDPYHVDRGHDRATSTATVISVTGTENILEMASKSAIGILRAVTSLLSNVGMQNVQLGGGPLIMLCPEHAQTMAAAGYSKSDVKRYLYENARVPVKDFTDDLLNAVVRHRRGRWFHSDHPEATIPVADNTSDFEIVVAGGAGPHSVVLPSFGEATVPITKPILHKDGTPVRNVQDFIK